MVPPAPTLSRAPRRVTTSASGVLLGRLCQSFVMARIIARVLAVVFVFLSGAEYYDGCIATPQREAGSRQTIAIEKSARSRAAMNDWSDEETDQPMFAK
jgi:hypothetical protein